MVAPLAADAAAGGAATAEGAAGSSEVLRPNAYKGGSTMAVDRRNRPPKAKKSAPAPAPKPAPQQKPPSQDRTPREEPEEASDAPESRRQRRGLPNPGGAVREGSWVVLGFLGWVWVALPFIKSGPGGVRDVLAAKFLNRTPGGSS